MKSMYVSATNARTGGNKGRVSTMPMIQHAEVILHNLFVPWWVGTHRSPNALTKRHVRLYIVIYHHLSQPMSQRS